MGNYIEKKIIQLKIKIAVGRNVSAARIRHKRFKLEELIYECEMDKW